MERVESDPRERRLRQACERCRQKKTRCPGERPECSFCKRLSQSCVYRERDTTRTRASHRKLSQETSSDYRVRNLESQVADLYNLLRSNGSRTDPSTSLLAGQSSMHTPHAPHQPPGQEQGIRPTDSPISEDNESLFHTQESASWSIESPVLPSDIIGCFVDVYKARVYFQPLPLFNLGTLRTHLEGAPQYLLWSFVALCLHYTSHDYFTRPEEAIEYYRQCSQKAVNDHVEKGLVSTEVLQTLCCLSLCDIIAKQSRAWINISTLTRLETFRRLSFQNSHGRIKDDNSSLRCYWSAFILETTFSPQYTILDQTTLTPEYPPSPSQPTSVDSNRQYSQDLTYIDAASKKDAGINSQCLRAISQWGQVSQYIHGIRSGKREDPWLPVSTFNQLTADLWDFEARLDHRYFFRNVGFCDRPLVELERDREYWTPWVLMQLLSHASLAVLNHPLIHLMALKPSARPRMFLQQTVDQALYHSGWVVRLMSTCQDLGFVVHDPLVCQIVASIATVIWFFQSARDDQISKTAAENMKTLEKHLKDLSLTWPHVLSMLEEIKDLQLIVHNKRHDSPNDRARVVFQPLKIWRIIDPTIMCQRHGNLSMPITGQDDTQPSSDVIRMATTFVHPVVEDQDGQEQNLAPETLSYNYPGEHELGELSLGEFLGDFFDPSPSWNLL